ncbi:MAG TPA: restriction endonuclease subunit S [Steroidobacteraceae bacterium]|nr:restriction endonuclease subunit S [Steroidobacteraceae bacterium]
MSSLPSSWATTKIGDVVVDCEQRVPKREEEFLYIDIASIDRDTKRISNPQRLLGSSAPSRARKVVMQGDVLVSMTRPNLNAVALVSEDLDGQIASTGLEILRAPKLDPRWLFGLVRTREFVDRMSELVQGALYPAVRSKDIRSLEVPLAPRNEQKRIADKLDTVLARADACRERLDRVPAILKRFRQSVLAAATSGKLTEEWRDVAKAVGSGRDVVDADARAKRLFLANDPALAKKKSTIESAIESSYVFDIPDAWVFNTWGVISEWITYGFTRPMPHVEKGVLLVTAKDVRNFTLEFDRAEYTTEKAFSDLSDKDRPMIGDLLITKDGTIGRAALVRTEKSFCINQSVAVCWLRSTTMNKRYLEIVANAEFTQSFILDKAKGMAIQHLSITDFAKCPVPVPSLPEQEEIVRRVEALLGYADRIETRYTTVRAQVERLTPALLAKAFRGELLPQDPSDEPASELLRKIRESDSTDQNYSTLHSRRARRRPKVA